MKVSETTEEKTEPTEVKQQPVEITKSEEPKKQPEEAKKQNDAQTMQAETVKSAETEKTVEKKKTDSQPQTKPEQQNIQQRQTAAVPAEKKVSAEKKAPVEKKVSDEMKKAVEKKTSDKKNETSVKTYSLNKLKQMFKAANKPNNPKPAQNKIVINTKQPSVSSLEEKFRKMTLSQRDNVKAQFAAQEFLKDYGLMVSKYGVDKLNSNDIQVLKQLDKNAGKNDKPLSRYLNHRIQNLEQINKLERNADDNFKKRQAKEPEIVKNKDGQITKIIVPDVTQPELQHTKNGCWSVALSSLLRHKGVDVSQETIRSFRPDTDKQISEAYDILAMNGDNPNSISLFRELIFNTVPDTAVNEVRVEVMNSPRTAEEEKNSQQFRKWTDQERQDQIPEVMDKIRTVIQKGLADDKGPVAILVGNHYRTVYGIENVKDQSKQEIQMLRIHDPNDPNRTHMSLYDLADKCYRSIYYNGKITGETFQFEAQWLQDLTNEKGELDLNQDLQNKHVKYDNHKLQCDEVLKDNRGSKDRNNGAKLTIDIGNDLIMNTYLPSTVKNLAKNRSKISFNRGDLGKQQKQNMKSNPKKMISHTKAKPTVDMQSHNRPVQKAK